MAYEIDTDIKFGIVKDVLSTIKPGSSGIIVYTKYKKRILFGFGIDRNTKDLCDFGGHFDHSKDTDVLDTAIREFTEESLGIFGLYDRDCLYNSTCAYNKKCFLVFLHVNCNPKLISKEYDRLSVGSELELLGIKWFEKKNLPRLLSGEPCYSIDDIYSKCYVVFSKIKPFFIESLLNTL